MSSFQAMQEAKRLITYSKLFDVKVALTTNKKVVFCAEDKTEAKGFVFNLRRGGYQAEMKKGLRTDRTYIAAYL